MISSVHSRCKKPNVNWSTDENRFQNIVPSKLISWFEENHSSLKLDIIVGDVGSTAGFRCIQVWVAREIQGRSSNFNFKNSSWNCNLISHYKFISCLLRPGKAMIFVNIYVRENEKIKSDIYGKDVSSTQCFNQGDELLNAIKETYAEGWWGGGGRFPNNSKKLPQYE